MAIASTLDAALSRTPENQRLLAAMRHAALLGGKRMRPLLVYATGALLGADEDSLDAPAVAVELIHAYSLVHDDLPAMDDDALRRGQPTVHIAFDEATAILAGDALQTLAFQTLSEAPLPADTRIALVAELAQASGIAGMCGGQALDIEATGRGGAIALADLQRLHALKTGALLRAAVRFGAIAAQAPADARAALDRYADALGLAFQIRDDLLDVEADSATLGKTAGKDAAQNKATFPALLGIDGSRARLAELAVTMHEAIAGFGERNGFLAELARQVVERDR
ncbi:MAG: polyprenyl synthetase family protein [Xanthomonadaceae bacterium]|nr:polyprenyl synthetase family protein [Xanthomonadaceae bacterium]